MALNYYFFNITLNDINNITINKTNNRIVFSFVAKKHFVLKAEPSQQITSQIPPCHEQQPDVENIILIY